MNQASTMRSNEARLCEAVIRLLEQDLGESRTEVAYPERDGSGPPVEVRLRLGGTRFAIEHTLIEPFAGAIRSGLEFDELVRPIVDVLDGCMPKPGAYRLGLPEHPTSGRPRKVHAALREAILDWVRHAASQLHAECPDRLGRERMPGGYRGRRQTVVDGLALSLERVVHWQESGMHDGRLFPHRVVGDDVEFRRTARIATALDRKLPKLTACGEQGDSTVLILEYSDIALTNHVLIAEALETALARHAGWPDYVVLADTTIEGQWHMFVPLRRGVFDYRMPYIDVASDV